MLRNDLVEHIVGVHKGFALTPIPIEVGIHWSFTQPLFPLLKYDASLALEEFHDRLRSNAR